nr:rRNA 2'-O-methyltransferase fibrillarin-like [Arachis hypogaea]
MPAINWTFPELGKEERGLVSPKVVTARQLYGGARRCGDGGLGVGNGAGVRRGREGREEKEVGGGGDGGGGVVDGGGGGWFGHGGDREQWGSVTVEGEGEEEKKEKGRGGERRRVWGSATVAVLGADGGFGWRWKVGGRRGEDCERGGEKWAREG